jgi:hypothetical protein
MSAPDSSTRKKTGRQTVGDSSGKDSTRRRPARADTSNSWGDHSAPNMSPNKSAKGGGSGKASGGGMLAAKDGRTAQQILAPKRATTDGSTPADKNNSKSGDNSKDNSKSGAEKRALPGGKGADKNPKSRKTMLKEKEKEHTKSEKKKKKNKKTKRTLMDRLALAFGFSVGKVVLTDPRAVEAANSLRFVIWTISHITPVL